MIDEVDTALRSILGPRADGRGAEVSFEAPTRDWAAKRTAPTLSVYLFDIREDLDRRRVAYEPLREERRVVGRRVPPRHFRLAYLLTAWTTRPEDEHRMIGEALEELVRMDAIPAEHLSGWLAEQSGVVPIEVAQPMTEDRSLSDLWTALGGELKPSLEVVVTAPVPVEGEPAVVGPPVAEVVPVARPSR